MIKKIVMNNCTPFNQAEISNCKKINFIFGNNGSGKSTISTFLADSNDSRFANSTIEWEGLLKETICVYNRDFRRKNFQETIPGVFTLGSATIDEINNLEQMKKDLLQKKEDWKKISEAYRKHTVDILPKHEEEFKEAVWLQILKANETDFQKAFEGLRGSKEKFVAEVKKRISDSAANKGKVCKRTELLERAKTLYGGKSEHCKPFVLSISDLAEKTEVIRTDPIWKTVIVGNEDIDISALIKELGNSPWVDQGRQYLQPGSNVCPFCQQETITDDFRAKLETFFDTTYKRRIVEMKTLLAEYSDTADQIITEIEYIIRDESAISIGELNVDELSTKKELLRAYCDKQKQIIEEKIIEPGKKIDISSILSLVQEIQNSIELANKRIEMHNKLVDKRDIEEAKLTDDVWATVLHDSSLLINNYSSEKSNIEKAIIGIGKKKDDKEIEINRLDAEIVNKGKNITSVQPTIDEINRSLKAYGFTNFSIQPAAGYSNCYCIVRNDGTPATDTLSEGEETFLTFLYFMQWAKGSIDPAHVSDKKIIVLDDPISSLDSAILYIVSAIIKDLWIGIRDGVGDVTQLFVLTHNVFFHREASFDPRQSLGNNINFWIIRKDNDISAITNYEEKNPISTSYELLWKELRENNNISWISIQNIMRRIIENYFGILGKAKDDTLLAKFETVEEKMIAKSLLNWINDGSHSIPDDIYFSTDTDAVSKYLSVFREIFSLSGNIAHYNMMMQIVDSQE